jgi:hypothetical protein
MFKKKGKKEMKTNHSGLATTPLNLLNPYYFYILRERKIAIPFAPFKLPSIL